MSNFVKPIMCNVMNAILLHYVEVFENLWYCIAGLLNTTGDTKYWIGLHDRVTERTFKWLDDTNKVKNINS